MDKKSDYIEINPNKGDNHSIIEDNKKRILDFINKEVRDKGYPPSVREICQAVGFKSTSTVHSYLQKLSKEGLIQKEPLKTRAIKIVENNDFMFDSKEIIFYGKKMINVPIIGKVTAGQPILAIENIEDSMPLPEEMAQNSDVFMLRVQGESMIDAGILDGDLVLVRQQNWADNGDIVVVLINDEATIKRYYCEKDFIRLQPENPFMTPIIIEKGKKDVYILGKVTGIFRKL